MGKYFPALGLEKEVEVKQQIRVEMKFKKETGEMVLQWVGYHALFSMIFVLCFFICCGLACTV